VVQYDHYCGCPFCQPSDLEHRPQRSGSGQRLHNHRERGIKQRPLISWRPAWHFPDLAIDVDVGIIHPDGTSVAQRNRDQPLAQPWKRSDAIGDYLPEPRQTEITGTIQDQDHGDVLRNLAGVHGEKRQIG
jgi:hypothetical protein